MNQISTDRFTPIRGTESQILASDPVRGYVWFAIDTKKIYYSDGLNFISMGGNSSIFYAHMVLSEEPDENQTDFEFQLLEIDGNTDEEINNIPNIDDLILNIPDGCFYRVISVNGELIIARKLTIAGSGTGGGGTGPATTGTYSFNLIGKKDITSLYGDKCSIKFKYTAVDADGDSTGKAKGILKVNGIEKLNFSANQGENELEIGSYLALGENNIEITLAANTGGTNFNISKRWTVNTVSVQLIWDYDETTINNINDSFLFIWSVTGNVSKTTHIIIDDLYTIDSAPTNRLNDQQIILSKEDLARYGLTHGAHKVEMYVTADIDDSEIRTPSTYKNLIFVESSAKNPIISCNFIDRNLIQYNTVQIPIIIYNPEAVTGRSTVMLRENNQLKDTWHDIENGVINYWSYTPVTSGEKTLTIICNETEFQMVLNVNALDIDNEEIGGYAFKFKATDFASNAAVRAWENNGVTLTTSENFDWINGGLQQEVDENNEVRQFVCIKAGTTMTIDYNMFGVNALNNGKVIKLIFKAVNCRDYDAQVLKCYDDTTNIGLIVRAQNAILRSSLTSLTTNYCEDTYIEFETDIWPSIEKKLPNGIDISERYLIGWLDGVPSGASVYSADDRFNFNPNNPQQITIGSDECDVYLYMLKVYERHLSEENHLTNFIADAPNANEMLARFRRNNILDDNGEISYLKLANANPECRVHLFDIARMTTNKKDPVQGCTYTQYHGSNEAVLSAEDVAIQVQGTSSAAYGIAAFNLDANFGTAGFTNADGEHISKWSMDENAIGVDYFNFKVNVASAEGANNALNQEWYNRYQPYICNWRKKNSKARDTMQFYPGVLFIRDNNPVTNANGTGDNVFKDTAGYIEEPFYKLYSVCNMGNSKKNRKVFHDADNPNEVCIEVTDNQTAGQWMTIPQGYYKETLNSEPKPRTLTSIDSEEDFAAWTLAMDDNAYDFRYPKEPNDDMRRAWFRLVHWMAMNDPSPKYNELGEISEEEFNRLTTDHYEGDAANQILVEAIDLYKIVNQRHVKLTEYEEGIIYYSASKAHPFGYTDEPLDEPVTFSAYTFPDSEYTKVLKGTTITDYAGTYTTDSYKYRIGKMLQESQNYLIMDALVFHYLFIERHCMIDSVAKNTFWSTEDLIHWAPIKDYDNDTADGNDNEGKLTLSYGFEVLDKIGDRYVFNAHDSVWLNFINGLNDACQVMYIDRQKAGAWDVNNYLNAFEEWQSSIPERCWIEDYHRKYLRPRLVYGSNDYIGMLEGGKKTHQRKQFEKYQDYYMSTKYSAGDGANDSMAIFFRANTQSMQQDYYLPITTYCDCYVRSSIGQQLTKTRVKRNEQAYVRFDHNVLGSMNDATCLLFMGELYTSIGDMSYIKPKEVRVTAAKRLRELIIGRDQENANMTEAISIGANVMLERLIVKNCTSIDEKAATLNLLGAIGLKELDLSNSTFTGVQIADNAPLKKLLLYRPSSLTMSDLTQLEEFSIDSYRNISKLNINNIDNNNVRINGKTLSQALVENSINLALADYNLRNVLWTLDNSNDIMLEQLKIKLLELLLTKIASDDKGNSIGTALALTGNLDITSNAYNGSESFAIYDKYAQDDVYPNLNIEFKGDNAKLYTIEVYDGNDELQWFRKIEPNESITEEFLSDGPRGAFDISKIRKSSTESIDYTFTQQWEVYKEGQEEAEIISGNEPLYNNIETNLVFKPIFDSQVRTYEVKFYNDNTFLNPSEYVFEYGTILKDALPKVLPYKDDSDLDFEMTNGFIGYGLTPESSVLINENVRITSNLNLYAIFEEKSVYDNVLSPNYYSLAIFGQGYIINKKPGVVYNGKITLPIINPEDGKPIYGIANEGFRNVPTGVTSNITHIFWERRMDAMNEVNTINQQCFASCTSLVYFEMPEKVNTVQANAFNGCNLLFTQSDETQIESFFAGIEEIQQGAFVNAGYNNRQGVDSSITLKLPNILKLIGKNAFTNTGFRRVQIGKQGAPSQINVNNCGDPPIFNTTWSANLSNLSFIVYVDTVSSLWTETFKTKASIVPTDNYSVVQA